MRRFSFIAILCCFAGAPAVADPPANPLNGTWEISALIDDGEVIPAAQIKQALAADGRVRISGQALEIVRPSGQKKTVLFAADSKASPATIDLANSDRTGGKGIYVAAGDTLMICLSGPDVSDRPATFASKVGSHAMLMTLQRVKDETADGVFTSRVHVSAPTENNQKASDANTRKILLGTWGHQDNDKIEHGTFNADGSFSMVQTWKKAYRKFFDDEDRFSGTWKLANGVLIVQITAATYEKAKGQVYTYRINSINDREMILVDTSGQVRREWKTR